MATEQCSESVPEERIRFIESKKGQGNLAKKVLLLEGHIFHVNRKTGGSTSFKCAYAKKTGCGMGVTLQKFDPEEYTFEGFTVRGDGHNHLPRMGKGEQKVEQIDRLKVTKRALQNCVHVCLFCYSKLPAGYEDVTELENVVPYGGSLKVPLNDPVKNAEAFELLCDRLGVKWRKFVEGQRFDRRRALPLCFKCQSLHQEIFHLDLQIRQLEELIGRHVGVIRGTIERTEGGSNEIELEGGTQLTLLGLDVFRKRVINPGYRRHENYLVGSSENHKITTERTHIATTPTTEVECEREVSQDGLLSEDVNFDIKQEFPASPEDFSLEDDPLHSNEPPWMGNVDQDEYEAKLNSEQDNISLDGNDFGGDDYQQHSSESEEEVIRKSRTRTRNLAVDTGQEEDSEDFVPVKENKQEKRNEAENNDDDYDVSEGEIESDSDSDFELLKSHKKIKRPSGPKKSIFRSSRHLKRIRFGSSSLLHKKEFTCHLCSAVETGQTSLIVHYKVHHPDEKRYTCKFCKRHFRDLRDCSIHQRRHTGERPFQCPTCPSTFTSKRCLSSHIFRTHTERSDNIFPCPECEKQFHSKAILQNHLTAVHDHAPQPFYKKSGKPRKSFVCHLCDKPVFGYGAFIQHYVDLHPEETRYTCKYCKRHFRDLRDCTRHQRKHTGERPFPCNECDKAFRDAKALRCHKRMHSDLPLAFTCDKCQKGFPTRSALTGHMNVHNESLLFCMTCGASFRNLSSFCKHNRRTHNGKAEPSKRITDPSSETLESIGISEIKNRMKCHVCWQPILGKVFLKKHFEEHHPNHIGGVTTCKCGKQFNTYKDCSKHAIRHSDHKTFQCDQCPQTFFTSTELRIHGARHAPLEERQNNVCDICGLAVVSQAALVKHKKKHEENQTRWVCEQCGKSYAEKKGLNHHTRTEHLKILPHKCTFCERAFSLKAELAKHMRSHTGQKPFKCPYCEKSFPYTSSKARHIREVHNLDGEKKKGPTPRRKKVIRSNTSGEQRRMEELEQANPGSLSTFDSVEREFILPQQYHQNASGMPTNSNINQQQHQYGLGLEPMLESSRSDDQSSTGHVEVKPQLS